MSKVRPIADQARMNLYEIMQDDISFEEKANRALRLGELYLGVQNGHLTKIDERINFWEAIASTDPLDGDFPPGQVLDLQTTYCRRVIADGASIALHDAPNQGWAEDPAFEEHGLHCYHGTPLSVDGNVFGTLCFVSEDPRSEPFSESETLFAELIARMLEQEYKNTQQTAKANLQANLISVLSRVLRHNLRNALTVVRGHVTWMAKDTQSAAMNNERVVERIDNLLALAETARQIESIATSDFERKPIEVQALLEKVVDRVRREYPQATFTVDAPEELYLEAIPHLATAFEELLENAAKHSGESPEVSIEVSPSADEIVIRIIDNGPGMPEHEQEVLRTGSETPLIHGSGLGLWLVYWIVAENDGGLQCEVRNGGTCVSVTLPRKTSPSGFADTQKLLERFTLEKNRFEALFEESYDPIVIFDDDGHYTDVNESAAELFGLPQDELRGLPMWEFVPDPTDMDPEWSEFMEAGRGRDTYPIRRADGTIRIVEYSAVTNILPGQHLAILRDVTEHVDRRPLQVS